MDPLFMGQMGDKPPAGLTIEEVVEWKRRKRYTDERLHQFNEDLFEMLMKLDPGHFKIFRLRWGLAAPPPPKEWDDIDTIMLAMHAQRVINRQVPADEKLKSARYLTARGQRLPEGVRIEGDLLVGEVRASIQSGNKPV